MTKFPALLAGALLLAVTAFAQQGQIRGPCHEDAAKYCGSVKPGEGRIIACLHKNDAKLTAGCKDQLAHIRTRMERRQQRAERRAAPAPTQPAPAAPAAPKQ